jgi:hypothetical protein
MNQVEFDEFLIYGYIVDKNRFNARIGSIYVAIKMNLKINLQTLNLEL